MKFLFRRLDIDDHSAIERDAISLATHRRFEECLARSADAPVESDSGSRVATLNRALDHDARHRSDHLNSARLDCRGERTLRDEAQEDWTRSRGTQHEHAGGCPRMLRALVAILDLQRDRGCGRRVPDNGKAVTDES